MRPFSLVIRPDRRSLSLAQFAIAVLVLVGAGPRVASAEPNLVAHWSFDAGSGADASGHGLDLATHEGASFAPGALGLGLQLQSSQWADHVANPAFEPGARSWTAATWFRPVHDPTQLHFLLGWYRCGANPSCTAVDAAYWLLATDANDTLFWSLRSDDRRFADVQSHRPLADGAWHHAVGTYSATNHRSMLYVDGVAVDSVDSDLGTFSAGGIPVPLVVGRQFITGWDVPRNYFTGSLDEIRLYDRALTALEVRTLFQTGSTTAVPPAPVTATALGRAHPEPFRSVTTIPFSLAEPARVRLDVLDVAGREVARLEDGVRPAGDHVSHWDGRRAGGDLAPAGVYFYRLRTSPLGGTASAARLSRGTLVR